MISDFVANHSKFVTGLSIFIVSLKSSTTNNVPPVFSETLRAYPSDTTFRQMVKRFCIKILCGIVASLIVQPGRKSREKN